MNLQEIRKNYPITREGIFLNHAATSSISNASIAAIQACAAQMAEPLGAHFYKSLGVLEETRRLLAELIGVRSGDIAFTQNTSTSLSWIASAVRFKPGDRVLVPSNEFTSNIYVWQNLKHRGVECELFDVHPGESIVATLEKLNLKSVKLISISSVSYETGRLYELEEFVQFCRERKIYSCLDAIQQIGAVALDVKKVGADFLAGGAQKWLLGPVGCGFLYARPELFSEIDVPLAGWTSVKYPENFNLKQLDFSTEMTRFEPGLPAMLSIEGLHQSLLELGKIGWGAVFENIRQSREYLVQSLQAAKVQILGPTDHHGSGIVSITLPEQMLARDASAFFESHKISVTVRDRYVRISPHFYTEKRELDTFLETVEKLYHKKLVTVPFPPPVASVQATASRRVLMTGSTGILGRPMAAGFARRGFSLTLLGRDQPALQSQVVALNKKFGTASDFHVVDLSDRAALDKFIADFNPTHKFDALVNCAGAAAVDEFAALNSDEVEKMFGVVFFSAMKLSQLFLNHVKSDVPLGILNIVSSSARCGYPLLSAYGASNGALWTLSEALNREVKKDGMNVLTFVAPSMHSRMQKKMGRAALRYFKMSGEFDYDHADLVAEKAIEALLAKKSFWISRANRIKTIVNAVSPESMSKKIAALWKLN